MLNARRHRRGNQPRTRPRAVNRKLGCSTPEGIGGGISLQRGNPPQPLRHVLNARRHRRGNQSETTPTDEKGEKCSTPEGIGGGISTLLEWLMTGDCSAQRPKASEGESASRRAQRPRRSGAQRPKASEGESAVSRPSCSSSCSGAQRPKASEGESGRKCRRISDRTTSAQRPKASEGESDPS